jgi:hypothetical protein
MAAHPAAIMVYGTTQYWYSWAEDANDDLMIPTGFAPDTLVQPPLLLVRSLREEIPIPCPSGVLVRRDAALEVGSFEESFRRIFTDQAFFAKLTLKWPVFVSDQNWFKYRKHPGSSVAIVKKRGHFRRARRAYLKWLEGYVDQQAIADPRVHLAIRNARLRCLLPGLFRLRTHIRYRALFLEEGLRALVRRILPVAIYRLVRTQREDGLGTRAK